MPYFFFRKLGKMSQNLSSAAVVIDALRVNSPIVPVASCRLRMWYFRCILFVVYSYISPLEWRFANGQTVARFNVLTA